MEEQRVAQQQSSYYLMMDAACSLPHTEALILTTKNMTNNLMEMRH